MLKYILAFTSFFIPLMSEPIVIFLNGTSSAGKTSIARNLQELFDEPLLYLGYDHFVVTLPFKFCGDGANSENGLQYLHEEGAKTIIKYGSIGRRVSEIEHQAMKNWVNNGFSIIIDEVLFDDKTLQDYLQLFHSDTVYFISIKPTLATAENREKERGDRELGLARGLYEVVYANKIFDIEIDTSQMDSQTAAQHILSWIHTNPNPLAFKHMHQKLDFRRD